MEFIRIVYVSKEGLKSTMAANHATNYSYKDARFVLFTILKI